MLTTFWSCVLLAGSALALFAALRTIARRRRWRWLHRAGYVALVLALPCVGLGGYLGYRWAAGQPKHKAAVLAEGVTYERFVFTKPRPIVGHLARIDLEKHSGFVLTPPIDTPNGWRYPAATTTQAARAMDADLVINGSYSRPAHDRGPLDYAPHEGDLIEAIGTVVLDGRSFSVSKKNWPSVCVDAAGRVRIGEIDQTTVLALSGNRWLVRDGVVTPVPEVEDYPTARSAIGLSEDGRYLYFFVVDGKQPRYSEGMSMTELAGLMKQAGVHRAVNLDGGGSSTLVYRDPAGDVRVLNRPCHTQIPGRQRPVANHLGLRFGGSD
ncbi:MAG: phosphodiester glycosidase family protein [Phycisphaeraceae bacterium]